MIGGHPHWFADRLREKIATLRMERMESLANGSASDFADYRYNVGYVEALAATLDLANEVNREMDAA